MLLRGNLWEFTEKTEKSSRDYHWLIIDHLQQQEIIRCEFQIAHWIKNSKFYPVGYLEFATDYFSLLEVVYKITKRQSGAFSTITADVQTKRKFRRILGPARFRILKV